MNVLMPLMGFICSLGLTDCSKNEEMTAAVDRARQAVSALAAPSHDLPSYKVTLEPVGIYKKGEQGVVRVVLITKGDYHINKQYPYKFVCSDPPAEGVAYPKPTVPRADGTYEERKAVLPVPFVPARDGEVKLGGIFSLSVCTDANCLMDKLPLELVVTVQ